MVLVRAVLHLSGGTLALTQPVVSQLPVFTNISLRHEVQRSTFTLMDAPPATKLATDQCKPGMLCDHKTVRPRTTKSCETETKATKTETSVVK